MADLGQLIEDIQERFRDYNNQLSILKKEATEDIDELSEKYTNFADWLESKKDEVDSIVDEAREKETELDLVSDQVNGILDDIEETLNDFKSEYQDQLENSA